jgi:hypothetical protein
METVSCRDQHTTVLGKYNIFSEIGCSQCFKSNFKSIEAALELMNGIVVNAGIEALF